MDYANRQGYLVIDEVTAVGMNTWKATGRCSEKSGWAAMPRPTTGASSETHRVTKTTIHDCDQKQCTLKMAPFLSEKGFRCTLNR